MAYRVEYNGEDVELATLDAALDAARNAIANDVRRLDGWTVEHDDTINDWFVQAVLDGRRVGPTAVVSGPDPVAGGPRPVGGGRRPVAGGSRPVGGGRRPVARGSRPVADGPRAVAGGPRPAGPDRRGPVIFEEWERRVIFVGATPAEAFALAADWLEGRPDVKSLGDVGWHHTADGHQLRLYFRG
jgi:hypothetical protein